MKADNLTFLVPNGLMVANFRYLAYNPDERYLSRYGRVTLYGSSCLAKSLLIRGQIKKAEEILRVWAAQVDESGKVPRSANVVGDNYISPDIRTGEVAHFLGALAVAKGLTGSSEWDEPIQRIVNHYIKPLTDPTTGLIRGGYNGIGSEGYRKPASYQMITWCSAEHNFDVFQALVLITRLYGNSAIKKTCQDLTSQIANGIEKYLWDEDTGTFNRGWRNETGQDLAGALDCCSWGALYLLKQARLAEERNEQNAREKYLEKARRCLNYADKNFKSGWYYKTPDGAKGDIKGYRPYDGEIEDLRYEDGKNAGAMINWRYLNDMVWSEGTLGVAKAWEEYAEITGDKDAEKEYQRIYKEMSELQGLSDRGGVLYSTRQIKGEFTMGEELASLSWLAYIASIREGNNMSRGKESLLSKWIPW